MHVYCKKKKSQQFERENVPGFPWGQIARGNKAKYQFNVIPEVLVRNYLLNIESPAQLKLTISR